VLGGTPEAGYGRGASPKTAPNIKAGIAVHNMSSAMLKSFMKLRLSHLISAAKLLAVRSDVLAEVSEEITAFWIVALCI
jgi:hypothetical protein